MKARQKKALITGINGQDGSYLTELLLSKNYEVHGVVRRSSLEAKENLVNIRHLLDRIQLRTCSIENHLSIHRVIGEIQPDECYHLAASSFVSYDFNDEASVISTNFNSTHFLLSCIRELQPDCRLFFAGSSEMFGEADRSPQSEQTAFNPRSIYGISKLASYHVVKNYRDHRGIFACTGISYNHESKRRGLEYVTRKITSGVAKIYLGLEDRIELGNLDIRRDWGYAPEYVEAMWRMLNADTPNDYVLATGESHSLRDLLEIAFATIGLNYNRFVKSNKAFFRPSERIPLVGNPAKIFSDLGWDAKKEFSEMIREMVLGDIELLKGQSPVILGDHAGRRKTEGLVGLPLVGR